MQNCSHEWDETYAMALCKKCGAIKTADYTQQRGCHSIAVSETQNIADSGAAFDKEYTKSGWNTELDKEGHYSDVATDIAWKGWQACDPEIEALKAELSACHAINDVANKEIEALRAQVMPEREVAELIDVLDNAKRYLIDVDLMGPNRGWKHAVQESINSTIQRLVAHMQRHAGEE